MRTWRQDPFRRLAHWLLPPIAVRAAANILTGKLYAHMDKLPLKDQQRYGNWYELSPAALDGLIKAESERATTIEDKAAKITGVLAVSLTIGTAFGKSILDSLSIEWVGDIVRGCLLVSTAYLLFGGWIGLRVGTGPTKRGGYGPDWEVQLIQEQAEPKTPRVDVLVHYEISNLLRTNDVTGALFCIRNGFIVFSIAIALVIVEPLLPHPVDAAQAGNIIDCEKEPLRCVRNPVERQEALARAIQKIIQQEAEATVPGSSDKNAAISHIVEGVRQLLSANGTPHVSQRLVDVAAKAVGEVVAEDLRTADSVKSGLSEIAKKTAAEFFEKFAAKSGEHLADWFAELLGGL